MIPINHEFQVVKIVTSYQSFTQLAFRKIPTIEDLLNEGWQITGVTVDPNVSPSCITHWYHLTKTTRGYSV